MIDAYKWLSLYRSLLRAVPRATSAHPKRTRAAIGKVRQGFEGNKLTNPTRAELEALYRKGYNTLGFLKLARELGSIERQLVTAILDMQSFRQQADEKPPVIRRKLQPLQRKIYENYYAEYDRAIANIERDLDIVLPHDKITRTLEWIPSLPNLYK